VPGQRAAATAAERARDGIPLAPKVWSGVVEAAQKLGVDVPEPAPAS
jgi:LDH2 family malate/lactate/ureidoglycolate dehydrogenase